ncbi:MAG: hypothetical protein R3D29_06640 [Nitratireductor sp.]
MPGLPGSSGNVFIDGLVGAEFDGVIYNYSWLNWGMDNNVTYAFGDIDGHAWSGEEMVAWQQAAQQYSNVANITFTQVTTAQNPEMLESWVDTDTMLQLVGDTWTGWHYSPYTDLPRNGYYNHERELFDPGQFEQGGYAFRLFMHEIGHGVGLFHTHGALLFPGVTTSADLGDNSLNQNLYTVMSYNGGVLESDATYNYGFVGTLMAFDIAAIQYLYSANMTYMTGDDTYTLPGTTGSGSFFPVFGMRPERTKYHMLAIWRAPSV